MFRTKVYCKSNTKIYANGKSAAITDVSLIDLSDGVDFYDFCYLNTSTLMVCTASGDVAKEVTIGPYTEALGVAGLEVHDKNYKYLGTRLRTDGFLSSAATTISFDPSSKTLTLNNATINSKTYGIVFEYPSNSDKPALNVMGTNTINADSWAIMSYNPLTISGSGTLTLKAQSTISANVRINGKVCTIKDVTVNCVGGKDGIAGTSSAFTFNNCTVNISGQSGAPLKASSTTFTGCDISTEGYASTGGYYWSDAKKTVVNRSGTAIPDGTKLNVKPCTGYGVYIMNREINSVNKSPFLCDGLSAGSISYDNSSSTLTLNGVTLNAPSSFTGEAIDAYNNKVQTVKILGTNAITSSSHCFSMTGSVTFEGYNSGSQGVLTATSTNGDAYNVASSSSTKANTLTLNGGYLKFYGKKYGFNGVVANMTSSGYSAKLVMKKNTYGTYCFKGESGAISSVNDVTMTDVDFYSDSSSGTPGCYYDPSKKAVCQNGGTVVKGSNEVMVYYIKTKYGITVAGTELNNCNSYGLGSQYITSGGARAVSYDNSSKKLTLNGVTIAAGTYDGIANNSVDGLTIYVSGINTISSNQTKTDGGTVYIKRKTTIQSGTLNLTGTDGTIRILNDHLTLSNVSMNIEGGIRGVTQTSFSDLTVDLTDNSSRISVAGCVGPLQSLTLGANTKITSPAGAYFDGTSRYVKTTGGSSATNVVFQKLLTPTVTTAPKAVTGLKYAGQEQTLVTAGSVTGGTLQYSLDGTTYASTLPKATDAGTYTVYYKVVGNTGYEDIADKTFNASISKAPLTVSGGTYTKKQGDAMPTFKAEYTGFKGSDDESVLTPQPVLTCEATVSSAPGDYPVIPSGGDAKNYELSYRAGVLTVVPADAIIVAARNIPMTYGNPVPELEYTVTGGTLTGTPVLTCEATSTSPVGTYPIVVSQGTVSNYNVTYVNAVLTILPAEVKVVAEAKTKKYGEADTSFTYQVTGLKNGDKLTGDLSRTPGEDVGTYEIIIGTLAAGSNYTMSYTSALFTIAKAKSTVTAPATATGLTYDGSEQQLLTSEAVANGGTVEYSLDGSTWSTALPTATKAGSYTIYYRVIGDANHEDVAAQTVTGVIAKAVPTVTAPEPFTELTENGIEQQLIAIPASTTGGTVEYSLDGTAWSEELPTAINPGNYTVYYRVVGDENYQDVAPQSINVTILVDAVRDVKADAYDDSWYTIGGQKLGKRPIQKGAYIHRGRVVVVK